MTTIPDGLGVALVTPFTENLHIDYQGLEKLLNHVSDHMDYLVVLGTTGEAATLTLQERLDILNFVSEHNPKNLPLVFGWGSNNTAQLIRDLDTVRVEQVSALLSASPAYNKPSQSGIIKHYVALADASSIPIIVYNVPGRTSSNLTANTTLELAQHPNIIGIKEASGDILQCMAIAANIPDDFALISGDDLLTPAIMGIGGKGLISVLANAFPANFHQMVHLGLKNKHREAVQVANQFFELNPLMYKESNPTGIKEVLSQLNITHSYVRAPLDQASKHLREGINRCLKQINKKG